MDYKRWKKDSVPIPSQPAQLAYKRAPNNHEKASTDTGVFICITHPAEESYHSRISKVNSLINSLFPVGYVKVSSIAKVLLPF